MSNDITTTPEESTFNFVHDECWICGTKLEEGAVVFDHSVRFENLKDPKDDLIDRRCLNCEFNHPSVLDKEYLVKMGFATQEQIDQLQPHVVQFDTVELDNRDENETWINVPNSYVQIRMTRNDLERLIRCFDQS